MVRNHFPLPLGEGRLEPPHNTTNTGEVPDSIYLDGRDRHLAASWSASSGVPAYYPDLPDVKDEFVRIPFPPIAGMDSRAVEAARRVYAQEAQIVDTRLQRNVTLHEKGASLELFCSELEKQTGVKLSASRGMRDEKATVLVNNLPARDVLREVARLFNAFWTRSGEEGAYEYVIKQDLKTQLVEEELRNKDIDAALLAMDEAILRGKTNTPQMQAYLQLTPAERAALRSGKELNFNSEGALHTGLPQGWGQSLLDSFGSIGTPNGTFTPGSTPGYTADITLSLNHTELGMVSIECQSAVRGPGLGIAHVDSLGTGRSPSSERPNNRQANKEIESDSSVRQKISISPKACQRKDIKSVYNLDFSISRNIEDDLQVGVEAENPHVSSADVWEAIHEKTGLPIIADYYTHLYPAGQFVFENRPLFDALCQAADTMGAHWTKDGNFILCRSASYFWDKLKEVPNRFLDRWEKDRENEKGLPLDDLLEMSQLSDQQLDSKFVGQGVRHCRDIMEWSILASPDYQGIRRKYDQVRPLARFLYTLPKALRSRMASLNGMPAAAFPAQFQESLLKVIPTWHKPATYDGMQVKIDYVPAGRYYWRILVDNQEQAGKWQTNPPLVSGKTPEEALAAARRLFPTAGPDSIVRSYGQLALSIVFADGSSVSIGKRPPAWRINQ